MTNVLVLLVVLQSSLRLSQWKSHWLRWGFALVVGLAVFFSVDIAASLSKPQVAAWLSTTSILQDIAVLCLLDALLLRVRWYPGLLIVPVVFYVLTQLLFTAVGTDFTTVAILLATAVVLMLPLLAAAFKWLLPDDDNRRWLLLVVTILICLTALVIPQQSSYLSPLTSQHPIMYYISQTLFGIANMLLIPDILLLLFFFVRSLVLLVGTYRQYMARRRDADDTLYAKYLVMLQGHEPSEAYAEYVVTQYEAEAAKDVNLSRLLTKLGPVLGLIGTLISMSPALVGLSTGDISGMAYNMQVVFSATVVGLFISVVGLFTQQLKSRWYAIDMSRLDYESQKRLERHETQAS